MRFCCLSNCEGYQKCGISEVHLSEAPSEFGFADLNNPAVAGLSNSSRPFSGLAEAQESPNEQDDCDCLRSVSRCHLGPCEASMQLPLRRHIHAAISRPDVVADLLLVLRVHGQPNQAGHGSTVDPWDRRSPARRLRTPYRGAPRGRRRGVRSGRTR